MRGVTWMIILSVFGIGAAADVHRPGADRRTDVVRVVAINDRFELADYESYATFEAEMRRLFELARPHLADDGPNLVVYPESTGLWTAFLGPRGLVGRNASTAEDAIASLLIAYAPQIAFYAARFGVLPADPTALGDPAAALDLRTLAWAMTDHMTRAFHETFATIAAEEEVWLVSCTDQAPWEATDDPAFDLVRDPLAPADSPTYVVPEHQPFFWNSCTLWNPTGERVHEARKEYLVPLEQDLLDVTSSPIDSIGVVPTAVGRLGFAISAPAWAHEVTQRLEQLDMQVQLQPDANPGDVGGYGWANAPASLDNWQPDGWRMASWEQLALSSSVQGNVTAMATGTVLDFVMFDGQGHVMHQPRPGDRSVAFVGSPPEPGFSALAPWVDEVHGWCPDDDHSRPLMDRRLDLVACSAQLEPGAAHAGEEVEGVISSDLVIRSRPAGFVSSETCSSCVNVARSDTRQWTPAIATAPDGTLHVVLRDAVTAHDGVHSNGDIFHVRSTDGGLTWSAPVRVDDGPAPGNRPDDGAWHPEIAVTPDGTVVVAYEDARASENVWATRSTDNGQTWSPSVRVSTVGGAPTNGGPRNGYHRLAVSADGRVLLVFHGHGMANSAARVYASWSDDGGTTWTTPLVVDDTPTEEHTGPDGPVSHGIGHAWRPDAAFLGDGRVVVVWQDFRSRQNVLRSVVALPEELGRAPSTVVEPSITGATWTDGFTTEWVQQFTPALDAAGMIAQLVWEDTRDGVGHIRRAAWNGAWRSSEAVTRADDRRERFPRIEDGAVVFEHEQGAQGFAVGVARHNGGEWEEITLGPGLAPAADSGMVAFQHTAGWSGSASRPDAEQVVVAGLLDVPAQRGRPPLPATGGGTVALGIALTALLAKRRWWGSGGFSS